MNALLLNKENGLNLKVWPNNKVETVGIRQTMNM